jgi:ketosteroid isomerase-like protein
LDRAWLRDWVDRYEHAWRTAGTGTLSGLFTADASYRMSPYAEPARGLDAIARLWEAEREGPDEVFTLQTEIVAVEGDTGVVRAEVTYGRPVRDRFRDLWIVMDGGGGRCRSFEEWPFWPE